MLDRANVQVRWSLATDGKLAGLVSSLASAPLIVFNPVSILRRKITVWVLVVIVTVG